MRLLFLFFSFSFAVIHAHDFCVKMEQAPIKDLDLDTAVYRALTQSLSLHMASKEAASRRYQVKQARLYPNPSFNYEIEDFAGNNKWRGWKNREERYFYSQLFETAGKRHLRTQAASYQYYASLVGYDISKLVVLNRLHRAFINVVATQELLKLATDQAEAAKEILRIATKKVEAGKVSPIQQNKAEVAYSTALVAVDRAKAEGNNAKRRLSLLWSNPCPDFEQALFPLFEITAPIPLEQCLADLCNQAEVVQALYNYSSANKNWLLEKANRIPDVTLQVGYKANYEENNQGMIAGVSIPIPLFNRNQGNIGNAYFDMLKTGDQGRLIWLILESKLAISYEKLLQAYEEAERIKNISLPYATQAFELAQKGYQEGKFEYLDVLDAQRTLFEVRERYIQALVNYHTSRADIDYLNSQTD
ncbi:TolC family protein [Candidatus Protochlamydia phocaeensis]|uniref:TolC family protein n=1 Tax=Candidatus Protochlamydia phocaeensis TaxID=1414722 RepID=UPI000837EDEC|nr:TolC family protein [Candidatus Protochlamydia phocaeensis]